jgi:hypothetical protein
MTKSPGTRNGDRVSLDPIAARPGLTQGKRRRFARHIVVFYAFNEVVSEMNDD